jgi:hypothetical protein
LDGGKKEPTHFVIPRHYQVARKVVIKSLEVLDYGDSADRPGMLLEKTLRDMVQRFDTVFGPPPSLQQRSKKEQRRKKVESVIRRIRKHTVRRRGEEVLASGFVEWEETGHIYELFCAELNFCERIFFTVDVGESSAILSKICSFFLIFMIILSIVMWMVSTLPSCRRLPDKWEDLDCKTANLKVGECPPEPYPFFMYIEYICVITFTIEYLIRLLTVSWVRFALLDEFFMEAVLTGADINAVHCRNRELEPDSDRSHTRSSLEDEEGHPNKLDGKLKTIFTHATSFSNLVDLLAIVPFWLEVFEVRGGGGFLVVLRILRLTRIFRVFKLGKYNDVFTLFTRVINQSTPALLLMIFFICLGCCLFGTLIWFCEMGEWYPEGFEDAKGNRLLESEYGIKDRRLKGAYLRERTWTGDDHDPPYEESPFASIIHSYWYVIVTITTVGYGDVYPSTTAGKIVAAVAILNGIIVLAMPIGVVGANFSTEYYRVVEDKKRRQILKQQFEDKKRLEEQEDRALNEEPDDEDDPVSDPQGTGDIQQQRKLLHTPATEQLRIESKRTLLIAEAEALEKFFLGNFIGVIGQELSEQLRMFTDGFICGHSLYQEPTLVGKPKIQIAQLQELDALTSDVNSAIQTSTCVKDAFSDFGLKEAFESRQKWQRFLDHCWEYACTMCLIEKRKEPPDYFHMKTSLTQRPAPMRASASHPIGQIRNTYISTHVVDESGRLSQAAPLGKMGLPGGPGDGPHQPSTSPRLLPRPSSQAAPHPPPSQPQVLGVEARAPESTDPEVTGPEPPEQPQPNLTAPLPGTPAGVAEQGRDESSQELR